MGSTRLGYNRAIVLDGLPLAPARGGVQKARRYDGAQKSSRSWDCLRRDEELWLEDGDCMVHLYGPGMSRRGPSLKVPFEVVKASRSSYLLGECLQKSEPSSPAKSDSDANSEDDSSDSGYGASICSDSGSERTELYIRAPADLPRNQAFQYHVGTRNFFAYLLSKPLVGETLGKALADLARRIELWQADGAASTEFLDYCQEQGYLDFAENPDYAAASLYLADQACIKDIWVDAFAHCVGMRDDLENSPEAEALSNRTRALISRAALEMELHLVRVTKALGVFLEEELGPEHLGISKPLRNHLDRFRSCLHAHYVSLFGYFPPDESAPWHKQLWVTLFEDFRNLYEYLADRQSSDDRSSIRGVNGGICVVQNVHAFDARHGYSPLPHPLPLLPEAAGAQSSLTGEVVQKGLRSFRFGGRSESAQPSQTTNMTPKEALARASNTSNPAVLSNRLVQEYVRFERAKLEERVSVSEARKVRWILVYSVLQMLISVTRAPTEVQDTETPSYPLCVLTTGCPTWIDSTTNMNTTTQEIQQHAIELEGRLSAEMDNVRRTMETDRISIHPDCEADNAEDYFTMNNNTGGLSRSASDVSLGGMMPSPLRTGSYLSRRASLRSGVTSLQRSVVGSFSRRNSTRRASLAPATAPIKEAPFCEILVEGYGNGVEYDDDEDKPIQKVRTPLAELEGSWPRAGIPTLEMHQLHLEDELYDEQSPAESQTSGFSTAWSESPEDPESSSSEVSSPGLLPENKDFSAFDFDFSQPQQAGPQTYQPSQDKKIVNAGTYVPTGSAPIAIPPTTTSKFQRVQSSDSIASSFYGEENLQAAEIEEEEVRGRRRVRGSRQMNFDWVGEGISLPNSPIER